MNTSTLDRICADCKEDLDEYSSEDADEYETLINSFMFDKEPSAQVRTARDLLDAMGFLHEGACIQIVGALTLTEDDALQLLRRRDADPLHYRYRFLGDNDIASIISRDFPLYVSDCMLEGLNITIGSPYTDYEYGEPDIIFPAIQVDAGNHLLLKDCVVESYTGTAVMVTQGSVAAEGCTLSSGRLYLGIVLHPDSQGAVLACRDCFFTDSFWGCDIPPGVKPEVFKNFMAVNKFGYNEDEDISRQYDHKDAVVQPWMRGWTTGA